MLQALQRIFGLRKYDGSIIFVPASGFETYGEPLDHADDIIVKIESESNSDMEPTRTQQYGYHGPNVDIKSLNWHKIDGPFVSIWLHNVPWGGEDAMAAPDAEVCSISCISNILSDLRI